MKTLIVLLLLVSAVGAMCQDPSMLVITNQTPEVNIPEGWSYAAAPGTYFWNGFRVGAVVVAFCLTFWGFKAAIGHDKEQL